MQNICFVANRIDTLYKFRKELIEALLHLNYQITIVTPDGKYVDYFEKLGCKIEKISISRRKLQVFQEIKTLFSLWKKLKKKKYDLVLNYTIKPNIYSGLICRLKKIPYILNITGLGSYVNKNHLQKSISIFIYKRVSKKAKAVFFQNEENLNFFLENGIKMSQSVLTKGSGVNLKEHQFFSFPQGKNHPFIYVARIMRDKGIEELLEAFEILLNKYTEITLSLYGLLEEENYKAILEDFEHKHSNQFKYYGEIKDLSEAYKQCEVLIHPSYHEGLSNVCLEAAAHGRIVMASNIPGCKETLIEGKTGFGFKERSALSIVDCVEKYISLKEKIQIEMGINARKFVELNYNRDKVVQQYLEVINTIILK